MYLLFTTMASYKVLLRKNKKKKDGSVPLYLRVTSNRNSSFISLGHAILEKEWDAELQKVRKNHPNQNRLNNYIQFKLQEVQQKFIDEERQGKVIVSSQIKTNLVKSKELFENYANNWLKQRSLTDTVGSNKRYKTVITKFLQYSKNKNIGLKYNPCNNYLTN